MAETVTPQNDPGTTTNQQAPGAVITPAGVPRSVEDRLTAMEHSAEPQAPQPVAPLRMPAQPIVPQQPVTPLVPAVVLPTPQPQPVFSQPAVPTQPVGQIAVAAEDQLPVGPVIDEEGSIVWTASEFIAHEKAASWYGTLALVAVIATAFVYLLTKDEISSVVVIVCALAFGFYAGRQPQQVRYVLADFGVGVGDKFYPFEEFRSFTIARDGAFSSIIFYPLKRFSTFTTIYYAPENEEQIVDILAERLPFEEHQPDPVDRLMRKVRF